MSNLIKTFLYKHEMNQCSISHWILLCLLFCIANFLTITPVVAKGMAAGTLIDNQAVVKYSIGAIEQETIESSPIGNSAPGSGNGQTTSFIVDRKIDLLLTGNTNANVNPGDLQAEVTFTLNNEGNDIQEFSLIPDYTLVSDDFDTSNCNLEVTGVTGTPLPGVILPTTGNIKLKADQLASIGVKCDIPLYHNSAPIASGQTSLLGVIATAVKNNDGSPVNETTTADTEMSIETVFADNAGTDDVDRDAMHSARRTYIAASSTAVPNLTMDKSIVSVIDSDGGNQAITGSEVTYRIQIDTSGVGTINNLVITDPTPSEMTYKANSISVNSVGQTDADDANDSTDFGITTANTATINLGDIVAGSQHEVQLTYIIN